MVSATELNAGVAFSLITLGFALLLLFVSVASYLRLRQPKLLIAGGAFLVITVQGGLSAYRGIALKQLDLAQVVLDFLVLAFLYLAVAKR